MNTLKKLSSPAIVFFFVVLFSYAAMKRFLNFRNFRDQLEQAPGLQGYGETAASIIIILHVLPVIFMCLPSFRILGLWMAFGTATLFTAYMGLTLFYSENLPCTCIGLFEKLSWKQNMLLSAVLMNIALAGITMTEIKDVES